MVPMHLSFPPLAMYSSSSCTSYSLNVDLTPQSRGLYREFHCRYERTRSYTRVGRTANLRMSNRVPWSRLVTRRYRRPEWKIPELNIPHHFAVPRQDLPPR